MLLAQVIPSDAPSWAVVALALVPILLILVTIFKRWADVRIARTEAELDRLKATHIETLRTEITPEIIVASSAAVIAAATPQVLKVLYIGKTSDDQMQIIKVFGTAGIDNKIVTVNSPAEGYAYLKEHHGDILFIMMYIASMSEGEAFINLIKDDETIANTPVIYMDGVLEAEMVAGFEAGAIGFVQNPLRFSPLLAILNRHGFGAVLTKDKPHTPEN